MRVLAITNIFPNAQNPSTAPYNRIQFAELARRGCDVDVLATIPYFPTADRFRKFSPYGKNVLAVPKVETIDGLPVRHPRTLYLPKIGLPFAGPLYAASLLPHVARYRGNVDLVLSAWAYPDGWASIVIGKLLGVPTVVKLHGSDINVVAYKKGARHLMRWVLPHATRIVAVNTQLARKTTELGVPADHIDVVYNGVDTDVFRVRDQAEARAELGRDPDERIILYCGNVLRTKGAVDLMYAFERVAAEDDRARLVVIGRGADRDLCEHLAARIDGERVTFTGALPHTQVARWMTASTVVTLPSWNEGTPNVLLEALACGRRLVASDVGGIPDIITSPAIGEMVPARATDALADALARNLAISYDPAELARTESRGSWADSAARLHAVLEEAVASQ